MKYLYILLLTLVCSLCLVSATDDGENHLPAYYVEQAKQCFGKAQLEEGKIYLEQGLNVYPYDPDMRWLMGRYYYEKKDYDKSRYQLIKAVEYEYNHIEAKQLLVNVEDITKHYSSAICYVNELLEINPYWRGLWRRKIELYRKIGNTVEADRLLKRISQIYPEDRVIQKDLNYSLETSYQRSRKAGNLADATTTLEQLLHNNPDKVQYYVDLTNMYLQQGFTEKAFEISSRGVERFPASQELIAKKVGILTEQSRYPEAMAFVKQMMRRSNSAALTRMYNELMVEAANAAKDSDPYILYGKIYERSKSQEALDFLLSTALSRGYDDDALFYLNESKKRLGKDNPKILYREYMLEKRMGNDREALALLQKLYKANPKDAEIANAMCLAQLREAERVMSNADWRDAIPLVKFVATHVREDKDLEIAAREKLVTCYTQLRRYNEALSALDSLHVRKPDYSAYVEKKGDLLDKLGRTGEALAIYYEAYRDSTDMQKEVYAAAYEEAAIPYIKKMMQDGASNKAYDASMKLLEVNPQSDMGLRYAINSAYLLKKYDEFDRLAKVGAATYPYDVFYKIKTAQSFDHQKNYDKSLEILRPELDDYPDSPELIGAFSNTSSLYAFSLLKDSNPEAALAVADSALVYDEKNNDLLYAKGLAFEKMHDYDSAYVYQEYYEPKISEISSYNQHMRGLQNKGYKNEVGLEYLYSRPAKEDVITSVATVEYTRKGDKDSYTGRINYKGIDGNMNVDEVGADTIQGGTGLQLQAEWTHRFTNTLSGMANLAWSNKNFPSIVANVAVMKEFKNEWEGSLQLGYRRLIDKKNVLMLSPGVSKTWDPLWANLKLDLIDYNSSFYYNLSGQTKFFLNDDGRTNIMAMAGFGTFPEITLVDNSIVTSFPKKLNTMVGLGGTVMLTKNLSVGVLGTWYTHYNPYSELNSQVAKYKNIYNVYFQLYINF